MQIIKKKNIKKKYIGGRKALRSAEEIYYFI